MAEAATTETETETPATAATGDAAPATDATKTEAPKVEAKETPKPDGEDRQAKGWVAVAQARKAVREEKAALAAEKTAHAAELFVAKELAAGRIPKGYDIRKILTAAIDMPVEGEEVKPPTADERVAALEKKIADDAKAREDEKTAAAAERVTTLKAQFVDAIKADDKFELMNLYERHEELLKAVDDYIEQHKKPPNVWALAEAFEKDLEEEYLDRPAKTKKLAARNGTKKAPTSSEKPATSDEPATLATTEIRQTPLSVQQVYASIDDRVAATLKKHGKSLNP